MMESAPMSPKRLVLLVGLLTVAAPLPGSAAWRRAQGQSELRASAEGFARAWTQGDVAALGNAFLSEGIRLKLPEEEHLLIRPRLAEAALQSFMQEFQGGRAELSQVSLAGGDSRKGFAEIRWETRTGGASDPVVVNLFVGFGVEGDEWKVTEIRILS